MERDLSASPVGDVSRHEGQSAVSWGAVLAGAVASLALSFVLIGLAAGFGLKLATPWPGARPVFDDFTPILGGWMILVQVLASALGGYLAGRLRTKWLNVHDHEVHFRDTAHGLLVWAVSTVAGAVLITTAMAPATRAANMIIPSAALQTGSFHLASTAMAASSASDVTAIQVEAAREANLEGQFSLFMAVGLLLGAFIASVSAALGGLRRDEMHTVYWKDHASAYPRA